MRKAFLYLFLLVAGFSIITLSACKFNCIKGSGVQKTETRKVGEFTKLDISGRFKINLKQDSSLTLTITADDNLFKYIKTKNEGSELHISTKKEICKGDIVINIGIHNLEELKTTGAIEVYGDSVIRTKDLAISLAGASKVKLNLNSASVTTEGSGIAELFLKGQASSHTINISGVGKIHALDFVVGDYDIESSGISHCEINVLHSLNVHTSGASDVKYRGNPSNVSSDKSGAASLERVN